MDINGMQEVNFDVYCEKCEHKEVKDTDDPCNECLDYPINQNSHKPVNYKSKDA